MNPSPPEHPYSGPVAASDDPGRVPPRWVMPVAMLPILAVVVAGWVAGSTWATLLGSHPLVLVALSPVNRNLILVTNHVGSGGYYAVGMIRHLLPDPFFFLLGYWYGARAALGIGVVGARRTAGRSHGPRTGGSAAPPDPHPAAFVIPNNYVSLLCGAARMRFVEFLVLNVAGTATRLFLCRWIGLLFRDDVTDLARWIGRYQWPITAASTVVVIGAMFLQLRPSGNVQRLLHLDEDPEVVDDE
ncbi:MAG: hypothetical protein R2698_12935 [Microthrixaceae bacterium]